MSDWDSVVRIGSAHRGGAGAPKEKVVKKESVVNAARRAGLPVTTEKKFSTGNPVSLACTGHRVSS